VIDNYGVFEVEVQSDRAVRHLGVNEFNDYQQVLECLEEVFLDYESEG